MQKQPAIANKTGKLRVILQQKEINTLLDKPERLQVHADEYMEKHKILREIELELDKLVGLKEIKKTLREVYAWITINQCRKEQGLNAENQVLHMMFTGNPGTGKTTVARLLGTMFAKMNVLPKGHIVEVERGDLVGEYIGHTALKTRDIIKKATGGILFIDEAYALGRGGDKDFGREAIDTLVKQMEDKQHDFVLVLAGYVKEMKKFLQLNPGLSSRFPLVINFPDYTALELIAIAERLLTKRQYILSNDARRQLTNHLEAVIAKKGHNFANGRYIRNIVEEMIRKQALRLIQYSLFERQELMMLRSCDLAAVII